MFIGFPLKVYFENVKNFVTRPLKKAPLKQSLSQRLPQAVICCRHPFVAVTDMVAFADYSRDMLKKTAQFFKKALLLIFKCTTMRHA
ncbi:hypothetical protein THMIRHAS_21880 [Thiosulfatimonas sediminis]|uniref:Uncharacterized protein n=1 Tax=Thiosulfatimonas sediminis TaxID=2675054 RepID=A0A6F8PXF9_9GAMM|nr:hypothetical protein THMIRHAS_21880 [Thiosulfatimonas sediminis]